MSSFTAKNCSREINLQSKTSRFSRIAAQSPVFVLTGYRGPQHWAGGHMCFGSIMRSVHASVMPMKLSWSVKIQKVHSWTDQREELSVLSDTCEPDDGAGLKVLSHQPPLLLAACLFTALQQNNTKMRFAFYIIKSCFGFFLFFCD